MSHRAGLVREPPVGHYFDDTAPTLAATVDSLNRTTLVYAPGTRTKYSNAGIAVVGRVLEVDREAAVRRRAARSRAGAARTAEERVQADARGDEGSREGVHVDVSRHALRCADVSARHGAGGQHVFDGDRSRPLHEHAVSARRDAEARDAGSDVEAAVRAAADAQRLRARVRCVVLRRSAAGRAQRRDLRIRDRRAGAAGQQAGRRDRHDARLHQSRDGAHRPGSAARDDARARQAARSRSWCCRRR